MEENSAIDPWFIHHAAFSRDNAIGSKGFQYWYKERGQIVSPRMKKVIEETIAKGQEYRLLGHSFTDSKNNEGDQDQITDKSLNV